MSGQHWWQAVLSLFGREHKATDGRAERDNRIWSHPTGILGRRDLLAVLRSGDRAAVQILCQMLQMERRREQPVEMPSAVMLNAPNPQRTAGTVAAVSAGYPQQAQPLRLWRCAEQLLLPQQREQPAYQPWQGWSAAAIAASDLFVPLEHWSELEPRLRGMLDQVVSSAIDVERLVGQVARLELVSRLPRLTRRSWGRRLYVVRDDSCRLSPLHDDQRMIVQRLRQLLPPGELRHIRGATPEALWYDASDHPELQDQAARFQQPEEVATVLVLGDLGVFDGSGRNSAAWLLWARSMISAGHRLLVLLPCAEDRLSGALRDLFTVRTWQSARLLVRDVDQRAALLDQLATAAGVTIRLEPGLLRELRQQVLASADGSLELDFWNGPWLQGTHPFAGTPDRQLAKELLLPQFESWAESQRQRVLQSVRQWRRTRQDCPEVWFEELLSLSASSRQLADSQDVAEACSLHADYSRQLKSDTQYGRDVRGWLRAAMHRYPCRLVMTSRWGHCLNRYTRRCWVPVLMGMGSTGLLLGDDVT